MTDATVLRELEERSVRLRGAQVRYFVGGAGPPIVLLHGLGGSASNWTEVVSLLAPYHRLLVPDLPGHGRSAPVPAACGVATFADRTLLLAGMEGMLPATFAGHSFGGAVVACLARRHPDAVRAAVLYAPAGALRFPRWRRVAMAATRSLRPVERALARRRREVAAHPRLRLLTFGGWGAADPAGLSPRSVLGFLEAAERPVETVTARRALIEDAASGRLADLDQPALLVWGAEDRLVPLQAGLDYSRRLGAPLRVLPATGHLLIGERPAECAALLRKFCSLTAVGSPAG